MTVLAAPRRLSLAFLSLILVAFGLAVAPSSPASAAVTEGISGHVSGAGGAALPGVEVAVFVDAGGGYFGYWQSVPTDSLGNYEVQLDPGTYRVGFKDSGAGDYVTEFWNDSATLAGATDVDVTSGHVSTHVDAQLARGGHITGHVAGGTGGQVEAWTESSPGAGDWKPRSETAAVSPTGDYDLGGLPTGTYRVRFHVDDFAPEFWQDASDVASATSIDVTSPDTVTGIDPTLTPNGHITGHVTDSSGAAVADVFVGGYTQQGTSWVPSQDAWAFTDASGAYDLSAPPGTYRLEFYPTDDQHAGEFYDNQHSVGTATDVPVTSGATTSGKDAVLEAGSSISGTVTLPAGADPEGNDGVVTAYDTSTGELAGYTWLDTTSGSGPAYPYTISGLPAGSYRVEFAGEDGPATSEAEFYDNHAESAGPGSADPVALTVGQQRTGVDATLRTGGTISGTVVDGQGAPVVGCQVVAFNTVDHLAARSATTSADGSFAIGGLTTAKYGVLVGDPYGDGNACPTTEYYTNTNGDLSPSANGIVPVSAAPGSPAVITAQLVYGGTVNTPAITNVTPPSLPASAPVVGTTLTVDTGTWNPADVTFSYQWKANGANIPGETTASYTPKPSDVGISLSVEVRAQKSGYSDLTKSTNPTPPVTAASQTTAIDNTAAPGITGIPRVGLELTAYAGNWFTPDGAPATALQWLRNGVPIVGATGATYLLGADDLDARISLRVTATKDGYQPAQKVSDPTGPVTAGILTLTGVPRVTGRLKVGRVLRAVPPTCTPVATEVRYQWLRNGVAIKGIRAKQARYSLVRADRHKHVSVRVTVLRPGYEPTASVARKPGRVR